MYWLVSYTKRAVYLDDIVVASSTFEQHLADLKEVLERLKAAGLSLKLKKCQFCLSELTFLGYSVTASGIKPDMDKIKAVKSSRPHPLSNMSGSFSA